MKLLAQEQVREVSWMYLADAVISELEDEDREGDRTFDKFVTSEVSRPQENIEDNFRYYVENREIDFAEVLTKADEFTRKVEAAINAAWEKSIRAAAEKSEGGQFFGEWALVDIAELHGMGHVCREFLRAIGHGVSAWDDLDPSVMGLSGSEDYGYFEFPHEVIDSAIAILYKHYLGSL